MEKPNVSLIHNLILHNVPREVILKKYIYLILYHLEAFGTGVPISPLFSCKCLKERSHVIYATKEHGDTEDRRTKLGSWSQDFTTSEGKDF